MFANFYSYLFTEEQDIIVAYFVTKSGTEYRAYFYPAKNYFDFLDQNDLLFKNGFYFGFTKVGVNEEKIEPLDIKVRNTIINIIDEFFNDKGIENILIYHCDNGDGKKSKRASQFNRWFDLLKIKSSYKKYNEVIVSTELGSNSKQDNGKVSLEIIVDQEYISLIIKCDNPNSGLILLEFQKLKEQLISEK